MRNLLFRQAAVAHLSSPEQLDTLLQIGSARSWLALVSLLMLVGVALVWSVTGTIHTRVEAPAILIRPGGVLTAFARGSGHVELLVKEGDTVRKDQLIATIDQPELVKEVERARLQLEEMRARHQRVAARASQDRTLRDQSLAFERETLESTIRFAEQHLAAMERRLQLQSEVRSPRAGVVVEVRVSAGGLVAAGAPVATLQPAQDGAGLEAVVYLPPAFGKSVAPGMAAQVSPLGSPREEFGFINATVTYVSQFPATTEGMMRILANESLVETLSRNGAPFAAYASLARDPSSASGFQWSSERGGSLSVNSGTLCTVSIITREQRPIELVVPYLRSLMGG